MWLYRRRARGEGNRKSMLSDPYMDLQSLEDDLMEDPCPLDLMMDGNFSNSDTASFSPGINLDASYIYLDNDGIEPKPSPISINVHLVQRENLEVLATLRSKIQDLLDCCNDFRIEQPNSTSHLNSQEVRNFLSRLDVEPAEKQAYSDAFLQFAKSELHDEASPALPLIALFERMANSEPTPANITAFFYQDEIARHLLSASNQSVYSLLPYGSLEGLRVFLNEYHIQSEALLASTSDRYPSSDEWKGVTQRSIGWSLFHLYRFYRDGGCFKDRWKGARELVLRVTIGLLEEKSQRMQQMRVIRDTYMVRWKHVNDVVQSDQDLREKLGRGFQSPAVTWMNGLNTISEDFRHHRVPATLAKLAGFLVLAWTVDGMDSLPLGDLSTSSGFMNDLCNWADSMVTKGGKADATKFIASVWTDWDAWTVLDSPSDFTNSRTTIEKALDWIKGLFIEVKTPGSLQVSRSLIAGMFYKEHKSHFSLEGISLEAMAVGAELTLLPHTRSQGQQAGNITTVSGYGWDPPGQTVFRGFASLAAGAILCIVRKFFESIKVGFPVLYMTYAFTVCLTVHTSIYYTTAVQERVFDRLRQALTSPHSHSLLDKITSYNRTSLLPATCELKKHLQCIPEIAQNHDIMTSVTRSFTEVNNDLRGLNSPKISCRDPKCRGTFANKSLETRHFKARHTPKTKCRFCPVKIRNRADYKRKHAKVCKQKPRDEF